MIQEEDTAYVTIIPFRCLGAGCSLFRPVTLVDFGLLHEHFFVRHFILHCSAVGSRLRARNEGADTRHLSTVLYSTTSVSHAGGARSRHLHVIVDSQRKCYGFPAVICFKACCAHWLACLLAWSEVRLHIGALPCATSSVTETALLSIQHGVQRPAVVRLTNCSILPLHDDHLHAAGSRTLTAAIVHGI